MEVVGEDDDDEGDGSDVSEGGWASWGGGGGGGCGCEGEMRGRSGGTEKGSERAALSRNVV